MFSTWLTRALDGRQRRQTTAVVWEFACSGRIANPLDLWEFTYDGERRRASDVFSTFDWVNGDGYANLGDWVEVAAKKMGK